MNLGFMLQRPAWEMSEVTYFYSGRICIVYVRISVVFLFMLTPPPTHSPFSRLISPKPLVLSPQNSAFLNI